MVSVVVFDLDTVEGMSAVKNIDFDGIGGKVIAVMNDNGDVVSALKDRDPDCIVTDKAEMLDITARRAKQIEMVDEVSNGEKVVGEVRKIIDNVYKEDVSVSDIVDKTNLSHGYVCNIFKRYTGQNMIDIITQKRINEAKRLLVDSTYKINEIAKLVGYKNESYCGVIFKKFCNMSPGEYRKVHRYK